MQPDGLPAERGDVVDPTLYADVRTLSGCPSILRDDRHFSGPIIDPVELERYQRNSPGTRHDAIDGYSFILIPARVVLQFRDARRM